LDFSYALQLFFNVLIAGSTYALAASGISLSYGVLKVLNFAHGALLMLGGYLFFFLLVQLQLPLFVSILLLVLCTPILSWGFFRVGIEPFLPYSPALVLVATLALSIMLEALVSILFGVQVQSISLGFASAGIEVFGAYVTAQQIFIISCTVVMLSLLFLLVEKTTIGQQLRAYAERPEGAEALGYSGKALGAFAFSLALFLAFLAGVLIAAEYNLQPTMGAAYMIKAFAAMIIGGLGSIRGTIAGAFILALLETLIVGVDILGVSIPTGYKDGVSYFCIILILLLRPKGLFARGERKL
jgi:branched-subunit amino acid ABC-type transport system permease component